MSTSLLDLSDEVLQLISQYVNQDDSIPIPSFAPHWKLTTNIQIATATSRDIRAFRATCRRLRNACTLKGLHVVLGRTNGTISAGRWDDSLAGDMRKATSRICIDVPTSSLESGLQTWSDCASCLEVFSNIEEMIIKKGPRCHHIPNDQTHTPVTQGFSRYMQPWSTQSSFDQLTSLSVEVDCPDCSFGFPTFFLPSFPKLKHLKFYLSPSSNTTSWDPSKDFRLLFEGPNSSEEKGCLELETLYLRYPWSSRGNIWKNWGKIIKESFSLFQHLRDFQITAFNDKRELAFGTYLICSRDETGKPNLDAKSVEKGRGKEWKFEVMNLEDGDWRNSWSLEQMMTYLSPPQTLKLFDPVIVIQPGESRPHHLTSPKGTSHQKSVYHDTHSYEETRYDSLLKKYESLLKRQMTAAAEELIDLVPSFEEGAFWERGTEISYDDWYRWTWAKVVDDNGEVKVQVVDKPFVLSKKSIKAK
ncbi:hypothetical protein I203_103378 [Kwoniella mangroviensis CBS 8507]|uniref:uncharacterized protein n=1 Tax=Kwoniella mangroviensis CBS 8507 TaxID=1296122 RepID=UPI00080D661E|nr:uncharacterized protein I203_06085 [Kwoniella mangroviensis CBS 8507]OCF64841.1 hypothetical protein I203_06085 [Kwoniella mangroviensis CBS 8507]